MKKFLFLSFILSAILTTSVKAQTQAGPQAQGAADPAVDPAAILQQMKEKQVPGLVEKVGLTTEQANKVIELNYEMRMAMSNFSNLSEAERSAKFAELKAAKEKKISEVLTPDQMKALTAYYADMGKNREKKN
jgi:hypothetical protein